MFIYVLPLFTFVSPIGQLKLNCFRCCLKCLKGFTKVNGGSNRDTATEPTLSRSKALKVGTPIRSTAARNLPTLSVETSSSKAPGQIFLRSAQSSLPPESAACSSLSEASDGGGRGTSGNITRSQPTASARRLAVANPPKNQSVSQSADGPHKKIEEATRVGVYLGLARHWGRGGTWKAR